MEITIDPSGTSFDADSGRAQTVPAPTAMLTSEQLSAFEEQGFLSIPSVASADEIADMLRVYDRLFEQKVGYRDGNFFDFAGPDDLRPTLPQIVMPSAYEPTLRETPLRRRCELLAKQLLGPTAEFVFDHVMMKPPAGGKPTPWHQDQAFYTPVTRHLTVTFWIPLQDVTREMGCLRFIPGSNRGALHRHRSIGDDARNHGLEALQVEEERAVYCPLKAGDASVHHWLTLHGADANITQLPRRAYAIAFGIPLTQPLMTREYAWNRRKSTGRDARMRRSLPPWRRFKQSLRYRLVKMGLL